MRAAALSATSRRATGGYVLAVAAGALAVLATGVALAIVLWLLPSLLALAIEREAGRPMTRAMALLGLAAAAPALLSLWLVGGGWEVALDSALDPMQAARCWAAQAAAWLLAELIAVMLVVRADWTARRDLRRLQQARQDLQAEWSAADPGP